MKLLVIIKDDGSGGGSGVLRGERIQARCYGSVHVHDLDGIRRADGFV